MKLKFEIEKESICEAGDYIEVVNYQDEKELIKVEDISLDLSESNELIEWYMCDGNAYRRDEILEVYKRVVQCQKAD